MKTSVKVVSLTLALSGCTNFIPEYSQPEFPVSNNWPVNELGYEEAQPLNWRAFVNNTDLQTLVEMSLENNKDLNEALLNIVRAEAQLGLSRATRYPSIGLDASSANQRLSENFTGGDSSISRTQNLNIGLSSYELDFWGRVYSLEQQALEDYLATIEGRRNTQITLISNVIQAYLTLESDRRLLALAKETLISQQNSLKLTQTSFENGVASGLDVAQAKTTVATSRVDVARFTSQVNVDINALNLLVGAPIPDELLPNSEQGTEFRSLSVGLPSQILLNRPDVLQAEHQLKAANANIGAARAAYFPTISLTTSGGLLSADLDDLFSGDSRSWIFTPSISLPIFDWDARARNSDIAATDQKIAVNNYQRAIQTAFQEVADALSNQATFDDQIEGQQMLVDAYEESFRLSELRFNEGVDDYFNVLDSQRSYYSAQQTLITTELSAQLNTVSLYKALGAGWDPEDVPVPLTEDMYQGLDN